MANVHTLSDLPQSQGGGGPSYARAATNPDTMNGMQPMDEESKRAASLFNTMSMDRTGGQTKPPREESYWDMWKYVWCPSFRVMSFTFLVWLVNTGVFVLSLVMTGAESGRQLNYLKFLGPSPHILVQLGALDPWLVQQRYEYWRLITAMFLSNGFAGWSVCSLLLMVMGFIVEGPKMSFLSMATLYIVGGVMANLFTLVCTQELSVGNQPNLMVLIGALLAQVIVNWNMLRGAGMLRVCFIFMIVMYFIFVMMLTVQSETEIAFKGASLPGEFGGLLSGAFLGMMLMPSAAQQPTPYVKMIRKIGAGLCLLYLAIFVPVFVWASEPLDVGFRYH